MKDAAALALPRPVIYVDVDDTFIRSFGSKRTVMTATVRLIRDLHQRGCALYCWSTGGADYAQRSAVEAGIADCFQAFLPKPNAVIDDIGLSAWRMAQFHPNDATSLGAEELVAAVQKHATLGA